MQFFTFTLLALSAFSAPATSQNSDAPETIKIGEAPCASFWSGCYKDEEARAQGYQNRDDLIKRDCYAQGYHYEGGWQDCGGWRFRGMCVQNGC